MSSQDDLYGAPYRAPPPAAASMDPSGADSHPAAASPSLGGGGPLPPRGRPERRALRNAAAFASDYDEGKMFIGGLNWDTTDESLQRYFEQYGPVSSCVIMRDNATGKSRGFAFLTFEDPASVNEVTSREHFVDGKIIDPKRAIPRPDQARTQKCFVGGVPQSATNDTFRKCFERYGQVVSSTVMMDNITGRPRGFGFVTYADEASLERCLADQPVNYLGAMLEVKRATAARPEEPRGPPPPRGGRSWGNGGDVGGREPGAREMGGRDMGGQGWGARGTGGFSGYDERPPPPPMGPMPFDAATMAQFFASLGPGTPKWDVSAAWAQIQQMLPKWGAPPPPSAPAPPPAWGAPAPAWGSYERRREFSPPRSGGPGAYPPRERW